MTLGPYPKTHHSKRPGMVTRHRDWPSKDYWYYHPYEAAETHAPGHIRPYPGECEWPEEFPVTTRYCKKCLNPKTRKKPHKHE